jgi:hypothetical protein
MLVGYMRVSTDSDCQVLDLQRDALLSAGVDERHLFEDRASGSRGEPDRRLHLGRSPQHVGKYQRNESAAPAARHLRQSRLMFLICPLMRTRRAFRQFRPDATLT